MRVIGAYQEETGDGLRWESADGKTVVGFEFNNGQLQIRFNEEWLWASPSQTIKLAKWLDRRLRGRK